MRNGAFSCSVVSDSAAPWSIAHQAPLPVEFSREEYWSKLSFPTLGDFPDLGVELVSLMLPAGQAGRFFTTSAITGKPRNGEVAVNYSECCLLHIYFKNFLGVLFFISWI